MDGHRKHILLAEDESNLATSLCFILTANNYRVSTVRNGKAALSLLNQCILDNHPIDLLITDIRMPEMNGDELLDFLQKQNIEIPSLAITGYGEKEMVVHLMRLGCKDFLDKPVEEAILLERVSALLSEASQKALDIKRRNRLASIGENTRQTVHDLRNLLQGTYGFACLALHGMETGHPARSMVEKVLTSADYAAEICRDLLTTHSSGSEYTKSTIKLNLLMERTAAVLKEIAPENIAVELCLTDGLLQMEANVQHLQQALLNLGFNAFAAMPAGGQLTLWAGKEMARNALLSGTEQLCAVIYVVDTGAGISPETLLHIFEEGFSTGGDHYGLGLSFLKKVVEQEHSGWIEIKSTIGQGTKFKLHFPLREKVSRLNGFNVTARQD